MLTSPSRAGLVCLATGVLGAVSVRTLSWPAQIAEGPANYPFTTTGFLVAQSWFFVLAQEVARVVEEQGYQQDDFLIRPLGFVTATPARRISYQDSLHFAAVHKAVYRELRVPFVPSGCA